MVQFFWALLSLERQEKKTENLKKQPLLFCAKVGLPETLVIVPWVKIHPVNVGGHSSNTVTRGFGHSAPYILGGESSAWGPTRRGRSVLRRALRIF